MPNLTQLLSIELGTECNLGHIHAACPNRNPERYGHLDTSRTLNDGMIVRLATRFYGHGFGGLVAWHYYQEPLLQADRMFALMEQIKAAVPKARFLLWTNGTLLPADCSRFHAFEQIHVTDYIQSGHPPQNLPSLLRACRSVQVHRWALDKRLASLGPEHPRPCLRPFTEFIVDNFGNVHLCCYDWRGLASPGNVFTTPLDKILQRWANIREAVCRETMKPAAPEACRRCEMRCNGITSFDLAAKQRAEEWRKDPYTELPRRNLGRPAVVFVFYRNPHSANPIPVKRLMDHFEWNDNFYRNSRCRVFVVTSEQYRVPSYAECLVFPEALLPIVDGRPRFSLSRTKNFGIAAAVAQSFDPIIVTDPDIAFTTKSWEQCANVTTADAAIPVYWMASGFKERTERCLVKSNVTTQEHFRYCRKSHEDRGATGMVAMCADNWRRIRYDERCSGYGAEDGFLLQEIREARLRTLRDTAVYHIAHNADAPQANFTREGFTRQDAWDSEFNPLNFDGNHLAHKGR